MQENAVKFIPRGIGNFEFLKTNNYYYADKTKYIEAIEDSGKTFIFYLRPRRFGKTLLISTLANYYDVSKKDTFDKVFNETYIKDNPTPLKNSYYILRFDFSTIDTSSSLKEIEENFCENIYNTLEEFYKHYENMTGGLAEFKKNIR